MSVSVSENWTRVMLDPRRQVVEGLKRTMKVGPDAGSNDVPERS